MKLRLLLMSLPILSSLAACTVVEDARITEFRHGRKAAVSLTFDDGILDHYTVNGRTRLLTFNPFGREQFYEK